jgi:GNAT superfamily N-acetyltransferase
MAIKIALYAPALTYPGQKQFDCDHAVINAFARHSLKPQVKKNLSVAYVLIDEQTSTQPHTNPDTPKQGHFVGFYTIAQHMIDVSLLSPLQLGSLPNKIPCSRLVMLGVDRNYQGQQLGSKLMKHAIQLTQQVATQIGSFGMYLDADPKALPFYQNLGFTLLTDRQSPAPSPLFLPLSAIAGR